MIDSCGTIYPQCGSFLTVYQFIRFLADFSLRFFRSLFEALTLSYHLSHERKKSYSLFDCHKMSFLLLKSTRRGQQGLQSQPSVGTTSGRNNNVSVASSSSRSNDSFFSSHSQPPTSQYNRFSNNRGSVGSSMNQVVVGDQVQVQRTQHHFQKRRSCAQKQPQQNQVLHGSNQQHEVCMDEGKHSFQKLYFCKKYKSLFSPR